MPDGQESNINSQAKADLPQPKVSAPWEDEPRLNTPATSKLGQAYEHAKSWLDEHQEKFGEKYLAPFRAGLDNMAQDLQQAAESGHTQSGGKLNPVTRALAGGAGEMLKQVPVGKNVSETLQAGAILPELNFENLEGHTLVEAAPEEVAYRARPVGQKGVSNSTRPVATSSIDKAHTYKENLESMTGQPHEVVEVPLKAGEHNKHVGPNEGETWYSFKKDVPEASLKVHGKSASKPAAKSEASQPMAEEEKRDLQEWHGMPLKTEKDFILARKQKAEWDSNHALAAGKVDTDPKAAVGSKNRPKTPLPESATKGLAQK